MNSTPALNDAPLELDDLEFVYELKKPIGLRPVWYILGALALLGVAGFAFLIGLLLPAESQRFGFFIASVVIPTMGALALFASAVDLMRSPRRVTVGPQGLSVEGERGPQRWNWNNIGWATIGAGALSYRRQLAVFDPAGKKLVTIGNQFADFDSLAESVKAAVEKRGDNAAEQIQAGKAKKSAIFLAAAGIAFLTLAIFNAFNAISERNDSQRLAAEGVETEAAVKRHYLYNVTPRLEYEFTTDEGKTITRDATVQQAAWSVLEGAETVPVRYVPGDPDNNRLVTGEVADQFGSPTSNLLLSAAVGVMALFFLTIAVMQWTGWDIDLDSKTGKLSIKRFGTGR